MEGRRLDINNTATSPDPNYMIRPVQLALLDFTEFLCFFVCFFVSFSTPTQNAFNILMQAHCAQAALATFNICLQMFKYMVDS